MTEKFSTRSIVLSHVFYGDNSAVIQLFTEEKGWIPTMIKGLGSKFRNRQALLQPLSPLQANIHLSHGSEVANFGEYRLLWTPQTTWTDVRKSAIAVFAAEVLHKTLQKHYVNKELFGFALSFARELEQGPRQANLPLLFVAGLLQRYGLQPEPGVSGAIMGFDSMSGEFRQGPTKSSLDVREAELLQAFLVNSEENRMDMSIQRQDRNRILRSLLDYMQFQLEDKREIRSLEILESVFGV